MKKFKKIISLLLMLLLLTNCGKEDLKINQEVTLSGTVTTREITKDNETTKVSILNLDEPIIIEGTKINKIELDYDKALKDNSELTIKGVISNNADSILDLSYSFSVNDIDDILSYINTFSNDKFSMTIPPEIIRISSIEKIDNGFVISAIDSEKNKTEVLRVVCLSNSDFKELNKNQSAYIEKAVSNKENTVVIMYPVDEEISEENIDTIEKIIDEVETIKKNIRLK